MIHKDPAHHIALIAELFLGMETTDLAGGFLTLHEGVHRSVRLLLDCGRNGRKAVIVGNGGSASIASHMLTDICNSLGLRAMVFTEPPLLTALCNDHGYHRAFVKQAEIWVEEGDLLIAVSSSGRSENILLAVDCASSRGAHVVTMSGFASDNPLRFKGHVNFYVASDSYGHVEPVHGVLAHYLADLAARLKGEEQRDGGA